MGQTADQIETHIEEQRMQFAENAGELQRKVKRSVDWRYQVNEHPMAMLGLAFGGGVLISALTPSGRGRFQESASEWAFSTEPATNSSGWGPVRRRSLGTQYQKRQAVDMFDNIRGALIGLAAAKIKGFFDEVFLDFKEQYAMTELGRRRSDQDEPA